MQVRCERCRAVFRHATPMQATALECSRCHHVFPIPSQEVIAPEPQGTLGGAATIAAPHRPSSAPGARPPPPPRRPERPSGGSPLMAMMLALVVVALGLVVFRPARPAAAPSKATELLERSETLIKKDDAASLDEAIHLLSPGSGEADNVDVSSQRAFAMLLLGASLRAESDDLLVELSQSSPNPEALAGMSEADRAAALERGATIKERLPLLTTRSDDLVRDGLALARATERPGKEHTEIQQRALWLADAVDHRADRLQAPPAKHGATLSWWHVARALAAETTDSASAARATMEKELTSAVAADASNLRAKWMLAGLLLTKTPPDAAADGLLSELLTANPRHEGAQRDRVRLKRAAPLAAAEEAAPR